MSETPQQPTASTGQAESEAEKVGIDLAAKLSYTAIDRSDLPPESKRGLLFSVYSFRCLFDNADMRYIHPVLEKYGCTGFCKPAEHPFYAGHEDEFAALDALKAPAIPYGGLLILHRGERAVRFDAGSPVWQEFSKRGVLQPPFDTVPQKLDLYEMVYELINLNTADDDLRAAWFLSFPYVMLIGAPHDPELYEIITETLTASEILDKVLAMRQSLYVRDSEEELTALEMPSHIVGFYRPYLVYKSARDQNGALREEKRFQSWLTQGRFADVFLGTEKLLDTFPFDDGILLCNIAARVSLDSVTDPVARAALLKETLALIESALERGSEKRVFLTYYAGLAHLGLGNADAAAANFVACTELSPGFNPAKVMLKALGKLTAENKE